MQHHIGFGAVALSLLSAASLWMSGSAAFANGRDYNDGPVVNVSAIRTMDGHFDDYMHWLATAWKKQEEAAKAVQASNAAVTEAQPDVQVALIRTEEQTGILIGFNAPVY